MSATYNLSTAARDYLKIIFNTRSPRWPQLMLRVPRDKLGRDVLCVGVTGCEMEVNTVTGDVLLEGQ